MKILSIVAGLTLAFGNAVQRLPLRAQTDDRSAIASVLMAHFDSTAGVEGSSALLSAYVTNHGPRRTDSGDLARLPQVTLKNLLLVDPPANGGVDANREWSIAARRFSHLYSIGDITFESDKAIVDVFVRQPLTSADLKMVGITTFHYTLVRQRNVWRISGREPILSTTGLDIEHNAEKNAR